MDYEEIDNIITLKDENGNDVNFEFLDLVEYEGEEFVVLLPCDDEEGEVFILKVEDSGDGETESYVAVEDNDKLTKIYTIFRDKFSEEFNFDDGMDPVDEQARLLFDIAMPMPKDGQLEIYDACKALVCNPEKYPMTLICAPVMDCIKYKFALEGSFGHKNHLSVGMEVFTNELIEGIHSKKTDEFRKKYTDCEILMLDDIQELAGNESTQQEVYYIVRNRVEAGRTTVIITVDSVRSLSKKLNNALFDLITSGQVGDAQTDDDTSGKKCKPYNGDDNYIFVSYSHKNTEDVMEIIEQMQKEGYRVWYDEGIDPGSEWDEYIAQRVEGCGYFIAFISEEYLQSENCRDELNFARDLDKGRLLVYLTDVQLTGGMAMRLNRLQAIHKYTYPSIDSFMIKLNSTTSLSDFK